MNGKRESQGEIQARIDRLRAENELISKQINDLKGKEGKFDATLAARLIEREWYLKVLENISTVTENEPKLEKVKEILNLRPEELE